MSCDFGIAVLRIGVADIRKHFPVNRFDSGLAYGGILVFIGRNLNKFDIDADEIFLVSHIEQTGIQYEILVVDFLDKRIVQLRPVSFHVPDVLRVIVRNGIHDRHDMLALEGIILGVTPCEVGAVAEIIRIAHIPDLVADFAFIGLYVVPGRILQMEYFQVL